MIDTVNLLNSSTGLDSLAGIVILAGGASSRMGTPKAELILLTGERLIDYHVRHALALCMTNENTPIMIADNERGFDVDLALDNGNPQTPIIHITDYDSVDTQSQTSNAKIKTGGALVAIESALQTLTHLKQVEQMQRNTSSWLLVISCDSLIPATDLWQKLQHLINQSTDKKVICLADEHHLYPLLGLYQLSMEPDLKAYIDSGGRRVMQFIKPMVHVVPFEKNWQHLTNFNTPEDFQSACASLSDL